MKKIVFDANLNIEETEDFDISEAKKKIILEKATKYYSYGRLKFKSDEDYKILTFKQDGKKYKLVVSLKDSTELTKEDWKKIFQKTHKNVILFYAVSYRKRFYDFEKYRKEYYGPYMDILDGKKYTNLTRISTTYHLNKLLWLIIGILSITPSFVSVASMVLFFISICKVIIGPLYRALDNVIISSSTITESDAKIIICISLLIRIIEFPAFLIANVINNVIGDIKNDSFSIINRCKSAAKKISNAIKTVGMGIKKKCVAIKNGISKFNEEIKESIEESKEYQREINDSLSEITKSMDKHDIKPKLYKLNTESIIGEVVDFNDEYIERSKKQIKIAAKQIKDPTLSTYYSKRLDDVCKRYRSNKNTESDIIKLDIVSELMNLKADLEKYIMISNNQTEIDAYLEEQKETVKPYVKTRQ